MLGSLMACGAFGPCCAHLDDADPPLVETVSCLQQGAVEGARWKVCRAPVPTIPRRPMPPVDSGAATRSSVQGATDLDDLAGVEDDATGKKSSTEFDDFVEFEDLVPNGEVELARPDFVEFEARIDKAHGESLALVISAYDGRTLLVGKVKDGPVERWNSQQCQRPELRIRRGDRITAVNGFAGDSDELLRAARADVLALTVRRLLEFSVTLEHHSGSAPLNLEFDDFEAGGCVVTGISKGLVSAANQRTSADREVRPGDAILRVNGADTHCAATVRRLTSDFGTLELRLRRPATCIGDL